MLKNELLLWKNRQAINKMANGSTYCFCIRKQSILNRTGEYTPTFYCNDIPWKIWFGPGSWRQRSNFRDISAYLYCEFEGDSMIQRCFATAKLDFVLPTWSISERKYRTCQIEGCYFEMASGLGFGDHNLLALMGGIRPCIHEDGLVRIEVTLRLRCTYQRETCILRNDDSGSTVCNLEQGHSAEVGVKRFSNLENSGEEPQRKKITLESDTLSDQRPEVKARLFNHAGDPVPGLLESGLLSDVCFKIRRRRVQAHKTILSMKSPVFEAMFNADRWAQSDTIDASEVSEPSLYEFLNFLYYDKFDPSLNTIGDLLHLGDKYAFSESLTIKCENFLMTHINDRNCSLLLEISSLYRLKFLRQLAFFFILRRGNNILKRASFFKNLKHENMTEILKSDLFCVNELKLLEALTRWGKCICKKGPIKSLQEAVQPYLKFIRTDLISSEKLENLGISFENHSTENETDSQSSAETEDVFSSQCNSGRSPRYRAQCLNVLEKLPPPISPPISKYLLWKHFSIKLTSSASVKIKQMGFYVMPLVKRCLEKNCEGLIVTVRFGSQRSTFNLYPPGVDDNVLPIAQRVLIFQFKEHALLKSGVAERLHFYFSYCSHDCQNLKRSFDIQSNSTTFYEDETGSNYLQLRYPWDHVVACIAYIII